MDFASLATAAHDGTRALVRALTDEQQQHGDVENDDFAHLENLGGRSSLSSSSSSLSSSSISSSLKQADDLGGVAGLQQPPLLSPTAEAELLELATNFLLYAAMVIVTILVAKIYFPTWLESREEPMTMPRSQEYLNVMDEAYRSDLSDEDEEEEEEEENLLSFTSDDDAERGTAAPATSTTEQQQQQQRLRRMASRRSSTDSNHVTLEFDQSRHSKEKVYTNLAICAIMLNVTFVVWGVLQERMLTRRYPRHTGEYFTYSYALVFTNRFWTLIMSGALLLYLKPKTSRSTVIYEYSFPSISNMLSSWCQYEALRYVSFPAVTLFKSFKLAPVMLMGRLLGNQTYPQYDYFVAICIGLGITMFMTSTDELSFDSDIYGEESSAKWTGVMLLLFFLFFDSFTSQWQSRMFKLHRDLSMIELMFATSAFSTALSFITLVHNGDLWPAFDFIVRHSEIQLHFFMFSVCSTIGQLFIFYTIKNFGAVMFAIIMTTRVLFSIAISVAMYGHRVTAVGFYGLVVVVGAVLYRIKRKAEGRQLVKWQGMGEKSEKEMELVQEWREHIDT